MEVVVSIYLGADTYLMLSDTLSAFALLPVLVVGFFFLLDRFRIWVGRFASRGAGIKSVFPWHLMLGLFVIIFLGQMVYWAANYPGGFNLDAYGQWDQVHGLQKLNNWHPVFTTMLCWLITRLCDSFAFCILSSY